MECPFSERFLQIIWNERLLAVRPHCTDGREVRVLSVGLWNRGAGPDFIGAAILIGAELKRGDVELHRRASEWYEHGHDRDSAYEHVILHVVWADDLSGTPRALACPSLPLEGQLQSSWRALFTAVETAFYPYARQVAPGACSLRWALTDDAPLRGILTAAGLSRFSRHGQELLRRGAQSGEEQALYERIFEGLGYANNRAQFRQLAQAMPLKQLAGQTGDTQRLLAIFFGLAGLLPDPTRQEVLPEFLPWVQRAWRLWWESGLAPAPIAWKPNGGRPLNSVHRRLAAGVFWLQQCDAAPGQWLQKKLADAGRAPKTLVKTLLAPPAEDPLWQGIRDFRIRLPRPAALLGRERRTDLLLNTYLPYLGARAELQDDAAALSTIREAWVQLPKAQANQVLKAAAHRFLAPPSRAKAVLKSAAQQQGMMDIFQNFCLALSHDCNDCPFIVTAPAERRL